MSVSQPTGLQRWCLFVIFLYSMVFTVSLKTVFVSFYVSKNMFSNVWVRLVTFLGKACQLLAICSLCSCSVAFACLSLWCWELYADLTWFALMLRTLCGSDCVSSWVHLFTLSCQNNLKVHFINSTLSKCIILHEWSKGKTFSTRLHVHPAKTQISLCIYAAWSETLLFT